LWLGQGSRHAQGLPMDDANFVGADNEADDENRLTFVGGHSTDAVWVEDVAGLGLAIVQHPVDTVTAQGAQVGLGTVSAIHHPPGFHQHGPGETGACDFDTVSVQLGKNMVFGSSGEPIDLAGGLDDLHSGALCSHESGPLALECAADQEGRKTSQGQHGLRLSLDRGMSRPRQTRVERQPFGLDLGKLSPIGSIFGTGNEVSPHSSCSECSVGWQNTFSGATLIHGGRSQLTR